MNSLYWYINENIHFILWFTKLYLSSPLSISHSLPVVQSLTHSLFLLLYNVNLFHFILFIYFLSSFFFFCVINLFLDCHFMLKWFSSFSFSWTGLAVAAVETVSVKSLTRLVRWLQLSLNYSHTHSPHSFVISRLSL